MLAAAWSIGTMIVLTRIFISTKPDMTALLFAFLLTLLTALMVWAVQ